MPEDRSELDRIWEEHGGDMTARCDRLLRAAHLAAAGSLTAAERQAAVLEAHTVSGTAAIFGRLTLSRLAKEVESLLGGSEVLDAAVAQRIVAAAEAMHGALKRPG